MLPIEAEFIDIRFAYALPGVDLDEAFGFQLIYMPPQAGGRDSVLLCSSLRKHKSAFACALHRPAEVQVSAADGDTPKCLVEQQRVAHLYEALFHVVRSC